MTEAEWLACDDPKWRVITEMTDFLAGVASERKLRLFAYACCQRIEHLHVDNRTRLAYATLASYVEGECGMAELGNHWSGAVEAKKAIEAPLLHDGSLYVTAESIAASAVVYASDPSYKAAGRKPHYHNSTVCCAANAAVVAVGCVAYSRAEDRSDSEAAQAIESEAQLLLLRDIFGNPFRPVALDPSWLTSTVTALARQIYESRDFSAMPILADALQDAGCDNDEMLNHCRGPGPHVRGCWVVDLVLGRE